MSIHFLHAVRWACHVLAANEVAIAVPPCHPLQRRQRAGLCLRIAFVVGCQCRLAQQREQRKDSSSLHGRRRLREGFAIFLGASREFWKTKGA